MVIRFGVRSVSTTQRAANWGGPILGNADLDKLKWAVFIFAVPSIVGGAVVYMTGQQGLNRDSFFVAVFGSLTFILGLSLLTRTLFRKQNRSK
jgi:hypothetical protein